jgi:hypothetical protein
MLVTSPVIARLLGRSRIHTWRQVAAGHYGPIRHRRGRWAYVELARVEAVEHLTFTQDQLRAAGLNLTVFPKEVA